MKKIEIEAKNVEEATALAAQELNCDPSDLKVEIIEEKRGFLGVGKKVKINATFESANTSGHRLENDPASEAPAIHEGDRIPSWAKDTSFDPREALENICQEIMSEVTIQKSDRGGRLLLNIKGDGSGIFIGRKGQTLEALQFIINKMHLKQTGRAEHIIVDSEGYTDRRISKLREKAHSLAEKVQYSRRPQTSEPLNAHDRRIIHTSLRNLESIITRSLGDGEFKRVQVALRHRR